MAKTQRYAIMAPNATYTGLQGVYSFANGVARDVVFPNPDMNIDVLERKGFVVKTEEEYQKALNAYYGDDTPTTVEKELPPVDDEEDDEGDDDDIVVGDTNGVVGESDKGNTKISVPRTSGKSKGKGAN